MLESSAPRVSVIVPVKDRRDLLGVLLDALAAQTYGDFETIVVDDGSTDGSGDLARSRAAGAHGVVVLDGGGNGAVAARKIGIGRARGEILAFTDSDCAPLASWLEHGVAAIDSGADAANGLTRPARAMLPLERSMGSGTEGLYPTCNMFYRRSAYDAVGGFDEGIATDWGFRPDARSKGDGFGEDTVLGWKVARRGGMRYEPEAVVEHHVFPPDYVDMLSRTARVAGFPAMVRDVPELRQTLCKHRVQLGERSRVPVYAVTFGLLARRRGLAAVALGWWAAARWRELRRFPIETSEQLKLLPVEMGLDGITAASLVVGSLRARSILL